ALGRLRERLAGFGITLDVLGVDVERLWSQLLAGAPEKETTLERIAQNILAAGEAGIPCLKYRIQPLGVLRTGRVPGRGGAQYSAFRYADWPDASLTELGTVTQDRMWDAIEEALEHLVPVAEACGVRLACHPQDAPLPMEGVRGIPHVLSSVDALERFLAICPSPFHGLNFCQGTVAEMCRDPRREVIEAIRRFGGAGKIFMVHFRNIRGGFGDFVEVYPDNGVVDLLAAARAYHQVGYAGMLCPDHVPRSDVDPTGERQFAFCLGYTRAAIQAVSSYSPFTVP
ncbi:MAG TPA: mannonate dehydratase, partial [Chloroflexota bacterium]|nr:mannonate dehydratase [Chloroflexota bacterium]